MVSAFQLYFRAQPSPALFDGCHRTENRLLYLCLVVVADQHGARASAGGWISLAFLRGLMGLTEASAIPAGIKPAPNGHPDERTRYCGACLISVLRLWCDAGAAAGGLGVLTFADSGIGTEMAFCDYRWDRRAVA